MAAVPSCDEPVVKPHFVMVMTPTSLNVPGARIELIGLTGTPRLPDDDAFELTTRYTDPRSRLRLDNKRTWAIARWRLTCANTHLLPINYRGYAAESEFMRVLVRSQAHAVRQPLP